MAKKENTKTNSSARPKVTWAAAVKAEDHFKKGTKAAHKKQYFEALTEFQRALQYDPGLAKALRAEAEVYESLGDMSSAAADYETYLTFDPNNKDILDRLIKHYIKEEKFSTAGQTIERRASLEKKKDVATSLLQFAAKTYMEGEDYDNARRVFHMLLRDDAYNTEIFENLKKIYHRRGNRRKWKACREVLQLNNLITEGVVSDFIGIFRVEHPLTTDLHNTLMHPDEKNFRKFFGWMKPLFKLMEQPTPEEILKNVTDAKDEPVYSLYRDCCHYLNIDPPDLLKYTGSVRFKFLVDPAEKGKRYRLLYNEDFIRGIPERELAFLFLSQLMIIRSGFTPLLNLSISDVAKFLIKAASFLFSILSFLEGVPLGRAAKFIGKLVLAKKLFELLSGFQGKLKQFRAFDRSPEELQTLLKSSADMMPEKIKNETELDRKSFLNQKFLENAVASIYYTADRVAYYFTRDLIAGTMGLIKLLDTEDALARVEKFGLKPFVADTKNTLLKNRLGEMFFFAVDADVLDEGEE